MFPPVLPPVSSADANALAEQIFSSSHSEFPTDHNTPEQNGRQRDFFLSRAPLLRNRSRWNLGEGAHWPSRCYVLGLLSEEEERATRMNSFGGGEKWWLALPLRASSESFSASLHDILRNYTWYRKYRRHTKASEIQEPGNENGGVCVMRPHTFSISHCRNASVTSCTQLRSSADEVLMDFIDSEIETLLNPSGGSPREIQVTV